MIGIWSLKRGNVIVQCLSIYWVVTAPEQSSEEILSNAICGVKRKTTLGDGFNITSLKLQKQPREPSASLRRARSSAKQLCMFCRNYLHNTVKAVRQQMCGDLASACCLLPGSACCMSSAVCCLSVCCLQSAGCWLLAAGCCLSSAA